MWMTKRSLTKEKTQGRPGSTDKAKRTKIEKKCTRGIVSRVEEEKGIKIP